MVSTAVVMLVMAGALSTFRSLRINVNDTASQLADANQNLRAGTNQLVRDLLMAGRIIGTEGIAMPTGTGITYARPGPVANMTFSLAADTDATSQMPSISTGYQLGPVINGSSTDLITILTVDEFMPFVATPPADPSNPTGAEGDDFARWHLRHVRGDLAVDQRRHRQRHAQDPGRRSRLLPEPRQRQRDSNGHLNRYDPAPHLLSATGDCFRFNQANATNEVAGTGRPLALAQTLEHVARHQTDLAGALHDIRRHDYDLHVELLRPGHAVPRDDADLLRGQHHDAGQRRA